MAETLEQALNELTQTTTDDMLTIDVDSRAVVIPSTELIFGVESDQAAERKYFQCPRYVGNDLDLLQLSLRINYKNAAGETDQYIVTDAEANGDYIIFSWELSRKATMYKGTVQFIVCAVKTTTSGEVVNEWNTTLASGKVLEGLEAEAVIDSDTMDVVNQLLNLLTTQTNESVNLINQQTTSNINFINALTDSSVARLENKTEELLETIPDTYEDVSRKANDALNAFIINTATGESIHVEDSADCSLFDIEVFGANKQESTTGKNLLDCSGLVKTTINGLTFTPIYDNGKLLYVEVNGTATSITSYNVSTKLSLEKGAYILSGTPINGSTSTYFIQYKYAQNEIGNGINIVVDELETNINVRISIASGYTATNLKFYPMVRLASVEDATYEPYTGGAPSPSPSYPQEIKKSVVSEIGGCGKNLASINTSGNNVQIGNIEAGKSYTLCFVQDTITGYSLWYNSSSKVEIPMITWIYGTNAIATFTSEKDAALFFNGWTGAANQREFMLVEGIFNEFIPYEPYQSFSHTLSQPIELNEGNCLTPQNTTRKMAEVVYDGDEAWGVSSIMEGRYTIFRNDILNVGLCSHFFVGDYASTVIGECYFAPNSTLLCFNTSFKTLDEWKAFLAENPVTVLYELAEPITEELPAADQEALKKLKTFYHVTHMYTDASIGGEMKVKYGADTKIYINNLIAALQEA